MNDSASRTGVPVPATLTCDPAKRELYASDTYYIEASGQLAERGYDPEEFAFRHATLLLKPDAVVSRVLEPAIDWLGENGFRVVAAERTRMSHTALRALWYFQWNQATSHRRWLADLLASTTDSLVLLVREKDPAALPASVRLTELKGPTAPWSREPGQLRYLLGRHTYLLNLAHTADEPADVLRELGVYFGSDQRDEVYASAMRGADQSGRARDLAAELYAETTPVDLSFEPAAARLDATLERALAAGELPAAVGAELGEARGGPQPDAERYRRALRACRRHGVELDPWDTVIVGSTVFPMTCKGFAPVLRGTDADAWYRHVADLDEGTDMDHLDFSSTIDRSLVHRAAVAEVFVTSHAQLDADTFDFGVQVPRRHAFYGDTLAGRTDHDPLFFVETCRQSGIVLAHEYFGVPLDKHFVLRDLKLEVSDPTLLAADDQRPTNAVLRCQVRRRYHQRDRTVAGLRVRIAVLVGGREVLEFESAYSWLSDDDWETLRRDNRTQLGLPAKPVRCPPSSPAAPDSVGRRDPSNVVISPIEPDAEGSSQALLVVDTGNATMFDHPLDHVPGMLQLEAARQLSLSVLRDRYGLSPADGRLLAISAKFLGFVELDLPARVHSAVRDSVLDDSANLRCAVIQDGRTRVKIDLRLGYPVERLSRPVATAGRVTHAP